MKLQSLVVVDCVLNEYRADFYDDNLSIQCDYVDFEGESGTICISASAIRDLSDKLHEAQSVMLSKVIKPNKGLAVDLRLGETRGEVTFQ